MRRSRGRSNVQDILAMSYILVGFMKLFMGIAVLAAMGRLIIGFIIWVWRGFNPPSIPMDQIK